ncbi:MAG: metal-dependent transcriptional regulator [Clostridia bacterium]|nr:metal-dependent transcriptional regulator [Clostridia bacterium]
MYLEVIYNIEQENGIIRSVDIAKELGYSKPSVNRAINRLKDDGLISQEPYGQITMTNLGRETAEKIMNKHIMLTEYLMISLGLSREMAEADACRMEHVVSKDTMEAVKAYVKKHKKN